MKMDAFDEMHLAWFLKRFQIITDVGAQKFRLCYFSAKKTGIIFNELVLSVGIVFVIKNMKLHK